MDVSARVEIEVGESSRTDERLRANTLATMRQPQQCAQTIEIVDIAPGGCGFVSNWQMPAGTRIWLRLPGLETWSATVAWSAKCRGGLKFDRPLHPAVAARFGAQAGAMNEFGENA